MHPAAPSAPELPETEADKAAALTAAMQALGLPAAYPAGDDEGERDDWLDMLGLVTAAYLPGLPPHQIARRALHL